MASRKAQLLALHDGFWHGRLGGCLRVEQQISQRPDGQRHGPHGVALARRVGEISTGLAQGVLQVLSYAHTSFIVDCG